MTPRVCIAIHDVAPATWPHVERLLALLDRVGAPPLTLLVVPDHHHRGCIDRDAAFLRAVDRRRSRGDEIALHGYFHVDDAAPPRTATEWIRRRILTAGEGEFAGLTEAEAATRIARGIALFERLGWEVHGFVAPAWLLGAGARAALAASPLRYTSTHTHLESIANGRRIAAPCLTASARSGWRRAASRRWLALGVAATHSTSVVRVGLHPADSAHADLCAAWEATLRALLSTREPLTKRAAFVASSNEVGAASTALRNTPGAR